MSNIITWPVQQKRLTSLSLVGSMEVPVYMIDAIFVNIMIFNKHVGILYPAGRIIIVWCQFPGNEFCQCFALNNENI
jgi:hypothetical protein